ncbi:MAG: D-aminoacyl-tRNA deacylase [uncultured Nocardioidaceae bacterium]|uniref:D-aminoacyl-tRNA deacylase n=1 Tax=uncultured Nocardioidaceae bacterium TaxID=253824 RepID=A0A6J4LRE0_9ACTN|nr:MAG: D-aminoacyl-tRNA deacylase [uncultured Nocardioidaceae bacterium]
MRAVVQRVLSASVTVSEVVTGSIDGPGLLVLVGMTHSDGPAEVTWMARKIWQLRIMRGERSAADLGAPLLVVSQFTLYGDARKGRRPTWTAAAPAPISEPVFDELCQELERMGANVARGDFGADMLVSLVNDGPVTILLEKFGTAGHDSVT